MKLGLFYGRKVFESCITRTRLRKVSTKHSFLKIYLKIPIIRYASVLGVK